MKTIQPLFILLSLTLTACGTASVAQRDTSGGQIALRGGYMSAMREARLLMAETCQGRFAASELQHGLRYECTNAKKPTPALATVTLAQR